MKFEAILFDCDGVLVDSEPITNGVLCAMLNEAGWALSSEECMRLFIGKTVRSEAARIAAHEGERPLAAREHHGLAQVRQQEAQHGGEHVLEELAHGRKGGSFGGRKYPAVRAACARDHTSGGRGGWKVADTFAP